jgi:hypothetical protein
VDDKNYAVKRTVLNRQNCFGQYDYLFCRSNYIFLADLVATCRELVDLRQASIPNVAMDNFPKAHGGCKVDISPQVSMKTGPYHNCYCAHHLSS